MRGMLDDELMPAVLDGSQGVAAFGDRCDVVEPARQTRRFISRALQNNIRAEAWIVLLVDVRVIAGGSHGRVGHQSDDQCGREAATKI
jgi:hypothetical protein